MSRNTCDGYDDGDRGRCNYSHSNYVPYHHGQGPTSMIRPTMTTSQRYDHNTYENCGTYITSPYRYSNNNNNENVDRYRSPHVVDPLHGMGASNDRVASPIYIDDTVHRYSISQYEPSPRWTQYRYNEVVNQRHQQDPTTSLRNDTYYCPVDGVTSYHHQRGATRNEDLQQQINQQNEFSFCSRRPYDISRQPSPTFNDACPNYQHCSDVPNVHFPISSDLPCLTDADHSSSDTSSNDVSSPSSFDIMFLDHRSSIGSQSYDIDDLSMPINQYKSIRLPPSPIQYKNPSNNIQSDKIKTSMSTGTMTAVMPVKHLEVAPGLFVRFYGADETWQAILNDDYKPCECSCCSITLFCITIAVYVLCPICREVSPLQYDDASLELPLYKNELTDSHKTDCQNDSGSDDVGVALGFTLENLGKWQKEIKEKRK